MSEEDLLNSEEYQKESAFLLKRIEDREEMLGLLKIAHPSKISDIRACIAQLDDIIERTEDIMEMHLKKHRLEKEQEKRNEELEKMTDAILPELLAHLEKTNPEAYEKLKASLEEIDARYPDEDD